ncbi:MAG: CsgG/HfaB family protein [Spirochaetaceae bacterium]|jgi:tetratricopeptide (TPR) repeat protein|nr:CsgG/HfaB family protein [Spirochaetaceae bacterium]
MKIRFYCAGLVVLIGIISLSCATSIPIQVTKAPTMDTAGISRLAVMPFATSDASILQAQTAQTLTVYSERQILDTKRFTLVDSNQIARLQNSGDSLTAIVDALFSGGIINLTIADRRYEEERYDYKTETVKKITMYERTVRLEYSYQLMRTRDNSIIDKIIKSGEAKDTAADSGKLKTPYALAQEIIDKTLGYLARDLAPWVTIERVELASDTSEASIKEAMKEAERLVKAGNYQRALSAYNTIYTRNSNFAAGYNAAILIGAMGDLDEAIERMQELADTTGNPKALSELAHLIQVRAESRAVKENYAGARESLTDSAIKQAAEGIVQSLKSTATIAIMNVSETEQEFVDGIIDDITTLIISSKTITVVERQNHNLIEAEQQFQMSGFVADDSALSIGHELGVSVIITCAITGTSSMRRLVIKAIDVETAEIVYQVSPEI